MSFDGGTLARLLGTPVIRFAVLIRLGFLVLIVFTPKAGAQERVGYVLQVEGAWYLAGDTHPIVRGQSVKARDIIRNDSPAEDHLLVVVNNQGQTLLTRNCAQNQNSCRRVIVPAQKQSPSPFNAFLGRVMSLWQSEPDRFAVHITRGGFRESVLAMRDGRVDLTPAFEHLTPETYLVEFKPLAVVGAEAGQPPRVEKLDWNSETARSLTLQGLAPGLYEMIRLQSKNKQPTLDSAWILIIDATKYEEATRRFAEVKRLSLAWEEKNVDKATVRSLLRAFLDDMARSHIAPPTN
jgi:hypothetical protein